MQDTGEVIRFEEDDDEVVWVKWDSDGKLLSTTIDACKKLTKLERALK